MCTVCQRPLWWCVRLLMLLSECHWLIAYFRVSDLWVELRLFVELMRTVCHWDRCDSVLDVCCYCSYDWITSLSTSCSGTDCWITFHCAPLWLVLIKKKVGLRGTIELEDQILRCCDSSDDVIERWWLSLVFSWRSLLSFRLVWLDVWWDCFCSMWLVHCISVTWFVLSDTIHCLGASRTEAVCWFNLRRAPLRPVWRCVRCLLLLFMWLDHKSKQELFWDRLLNYFALCATVTGVQLR